MIELTHPDRLYWPDDGVTKQGLADYYAEVWPRMAPFVVGRALALVRCPDGVTGQKFFQKHAWKGVSSAIALVEDPREKGEPLISIRDLDGLTALVQMAVLEIHPWGSTVSDWERPDTIVMDLDPADDVAWETVIEAATEVRRRLEEAGLAAFVKTSGRQGPARGRAGRSRKPSGRPSRRSPKGSPTRWPPTVRTATSPRSPRRNGPARS